MTNSSPALSPLSGPVSLEKLAYDSIKAAILTFQLRPDEIVVETDLARQLGISKTPVREALSRLEKEGFITKTPYKGYAVAPISKDHVTEIFEIRAALEGLAARRAAPLFTVEDLEAAHLLVERQHAAMQANDPDQASRLNRQFHALILARSGNIQLQDILTNLDEHLQRYRMLSNFQSGRLEKSVSEHDTILAAFRAHQPQEAENAVRAHLLSVLADLQLQDFAELVDRVHDRAASPSRQP